MTITLTALQKQRRDTAANWTAENPTLLAGEIGIESNTGKIKIGTGATAWNSLAYQGIIPSSGAYPLSQLIMPLGTAAAPAVTFTGDVNTGIYSPGADQLAISTGGSGRLQISSDGVVTVGPNPSTLARVVIPSSFNSFHLALTTASNGTLGALMDANGGFIGTFAGSTTDALRLGTGGTEKLRITSAGLVGIGTSAASTILHAAGTVTAGANGVANGAFDIKRSSDGLSVAGLDIDTVNSVARLSTAYSFLAFRTEGTEKVRITDQGRVGIGTTGPQASFVVSDAGANGIEMSPVGGSSLIQSYNRSTSAYSILNYAGTQHVFTNGALERCRIDGSGRLLVGTSTSIGGNTTESIGNIGIYRFTAADSGPFLNVGKSRSATTGTNVIVQADDNLGTLAFYGANGTGYDPAAWIRAAVDGTPGASNDMPGRLVFSTCPDGSASPSPRMTIKNDGAVLIGQTTWDTDQVGFSVLQNGQIASTRSGAHVAIINRTTNDGDLILFRQDGTTEGTISVSGTTVSYNGAHLSRWSQLPSGQDRIQILRGTVLSNTDEMCEWGDEENEQLNRMKVSDVEGDKNVSGVFQAWDDDDDTYTNDFYCAMTGDFIIRIGAGVTVERGDLLMSAGDGTAKPQDDDIIRSKTIAKVTSTNVSCTYDDGSYCVPCVLMAC